MKQLIRRSMMVMLALALALGAWGGMPVGRVAAAGSTTVVISQVYGGGGATNSIYTHDYIELFNLGTSTVNLDGWSVQCTWAEGTGWGGSNLTNLSGTIAPGQYYLIRGGPTCPHIPGVSCGIPLPTPDIDGIFVLNPTAGKVALVNTTTALTDACPTGAQIIDFVGYGTTANCHEGNDRAPAPSNTMAVIRGDHGYKENNQNSTDFSTGRPTPRNTSNSSVCQSQQTGTWATAGTWACGFVPYPNQAAVLLNGHTVTLGANRQVRTLTINSGGVFDPSTFALTIVDTITNNGAMKQTSTVNNATVPFLNISTDKYFGVDIATTHDMRDTTVTVWGNQACPEATLPTVKRCFDIDPDNGEAISDISFYYLLTEANSQTTPKVWHWDPLSVKWELENSGPCASVPMGYGCVKGLGIDSYSSFALSNGPPGPTAVDLADFAAAWQGDAVRVTWETAQELDNLGFNLYRGAGATGPWVKLNATLIPTQNPGAVFGAVYEWLDAGATPGATPFYRLEDVDIHGVSTFHGPVSATPAGPSAITLAVFGGRGPVLGLALALAATLGALGLARKRRT